MANQLDYDAALIRLSIGSDNDVVLYGLRDGRTGEYVNDATVTFSLLTTAGSVFGSVSDVTMSYASSSNGRYVGVIPDTVAMVDGTQYIVEITATDSSSSDLTIRKSQKARYEGEIP